MNWTVRTREKTGEQLDNRVKKENQGKPDGAQESFEELFLLTSAVRRIRQRADLSHAQRILSYARFWIGIWQPEKWQ